MKRLLPLALVVLSCAPERELPGDPPPLVTVVSGSAQPAAGAVGVPLDAEVRLRFTGALAASSVVNAFSVEDADGNGVNGTLFVESAGNAIAFVPSARFAIHTRYRASVSPRLLDVYGRPLGTGFEWEFETGADDGAARAAPALVGVTPVDGASDVSVHVKPTLLFSHAMNAASLERATRLENLEGVAVDRTVVLSDDGRSAVVRVAAPLPVSTVHVLRVTTEAQSVDGLALAAERRWVFVTSSDPTHGAPLGVISHAPTTDATEVLLRTGVSVRFTRAVDEATLATGFVLRRVSDASTVATSTAWDASTQTATFQPLTRLAPAVTYEAALDGVRSDEGLGLAEPRVWRFTTTTDPERGERPRVVSTVPSDGEHGVARTSAIVVTFSKAIDAATVAGVLVRIGADDVAVGRVLATDGRTLTLTPEAMLPFDAEVVVSLPDSLRDQEALALEPSSFSFRTETDTVKPSVLTTSPSDGATGVARNASIEAVFSEDVVAGSIVVEVIVDGGAAVAGTGSYDARTRTVAFTTDQPMVAQTRHEVTISGARDGAANEMDPVVFSFTTGGRLDTTPPLFNGLSEVSPQGETSTRLTWTAAVDEESPGITYRIWMAQLPASIDFGAAPAFVSGVDATSFVVNGLVAGATYVFAVRAVDGARNVDANELVRTATQPDLTPPSFAGATTCEPVPGTESLLVRWPAATDNVSATDGMRYRVYVAASSGLHDFSSAGRVVETEPGSVEATFAERIAGEALVGGRTYFVAVRAVDAAGNESQTRIERSARVADVRPPVFAGAVTAEATTRTTVRVSWEAASDAVDAPSSLRYRVFVRAAGEEFPTTPAAETTGLLQREVTVAQPGVEYGFRVEAIDTAGNATTNPNIASASTDGAAPAFANDDPALVCTSSAPERADCSWTAATDDRTAAGSIAYLVYRKAGTATGLFDTAPEVVTGATTKSWTGLAAGTWFFGVRARDLVGNVDANTLSASVVVAERPVTWATDIRPILERRCSECHNGSETFTYQYLLAATRTHRCGPTTYRYVTPGAPDESALVRVIDWSLSNRCSPSMPRDGNMPAAEIALIRKWIAAPNNAREN